MILRTELDDLGVLLTYSYINIEVVANISIDLGGFTLKMTSLHLVDPPKQNQSSSPFLAGRSSYRLERCTLGVGTIVQHDEVRSSRSSTCK